jgi:hypothetical protein
LDTEERRMKQTFVIEHNLSRRIEADAVEDRLSEIGMGITVTVTEITEPSDPERCKWKPDGHGWFDSSCGEDELRIEYGWTHCPYCGKPIEISE